MLQFPSFVITLPRITDDRYLLDSDIFTSKLIHLVASITDDHESNFVIKNDDDDTSSINDCNSENNRRTSDNRLIFPDNSIIKQWFYW